MTSSAEQPSLPDEPMDFAFDAMVKQGQDWIDKGYDIYQRYTCIGCGKRMSYDTPNVFAEQGICGHCGSTTDLREHGCNFLVRMTINIDTKDQGEEGAASSDNDNDRDIPRGPEQSEPIGEVGDRPHGSASGPDGD